MHKISEEKYKRMRNLSTENNIISALAIDQRGSIRKMFEAEGGVEDIQSSVENFKILVSEILTPYASSILLDPEYGIPASEKREKNSGLLLAYEETGYDATTPGRMPNLLKDWSAKRIKENGADAVKFLLYYDVDDDEKINNWKKAFTERIGSECLAEDIPFFLEIVTYDCKNDDVKGVHYAKLKPRKVIESMKLFSESRFNVDVLKVEVPINMNYVEGYNESNNIVYTQDEAAEFFKQQDKSTHLPYIYLSAGVSPELFQKTLEFASKSGSQFNGVLCGRATWKNAVPEFVKNGRQSAQEWLNTKGIENINSLNKVLEDTATSWTSKISVTDNSKGES